MTRVALMKFGRTVTTVPVGGSFLDDSRTWAELLAEGARRNAARISERRAADALDSIIRRDPTVLDPRP